MLDAPSLIFATLALGATTTAPAAPPSARGDDAALAVALEAVQPARLSADLRFLASDALRGRDTPSPELRVAALYLRNRVERLGFTPGARDGWFHTYSLHRAHLDGAASSLELSSSLGRERLEFGSDYFLQLASHAFDSRLDAGVVCVGGGSEEEVAAAELEGRWALLIDTGRMFKKAVRRCRAAGALGVVATPGPDFDLERRGTYDERYGERARDMLAPGRPRLKPREPKGELPQVMLPRATAQRLYALAPRRWEGEHPPAGHDLGLELREERALAREQLDVENVCALWPGSDPTLAGEVMIVSAHFDHVGERRGEIFNGADDNASGTTGLLALADALVAYGPLKRSVLLLWVSGEEKGLWGSQAWTEDPWLPDGARPVLDVNLDMIGRTEGDELYITPSREHDAFNSLAKAAYRLAPAEGFPELQSQDEYWRRSDHMNFNDNLEIPVVFLSTGDHEDYHQPSDTADKIDYEKSSRIVRLVMRLLDDVQDTELRR